MVFLALDLVRHSWSNERFEGCFFIWIFCSSVVRCIYKWRISCYSFILREYQVHAMRGLLLKAFGWRIQQLGIDSAVMYIYIVYLHLYVPTLQQVRGTGLSNSLCMQSLSVDCTSLVSIAKCTHKVYTKLNCG